MPLTDEISQIHAKALELRSIFAANPALADAELTECLRFQATRCVFLGWLGQERVVFKQISGENSKQIVLAQRDELKFMAAYMAEGPYQLNRHIATVPESRLSVLSYVPGKPLAKILLQAENRQRAELVQKVGEWLQCYCDPRRLQKPFAAEYWVKRLTTEIAAQPEYATRAVASEMLEHLQRQAHGLANAQVTHAATHGDLTAWNLHLHDEVLYGVNVDRETRMPIARDVATFLCRLQRNTPRQEAQHRHGIAASDYKAFLACGILSEVEAESVLTFLIGLEFTRLWLGEEIGSQRRMHLKQAIDRYLEEPV